MKSIVTGGAGFIGSHLAEALLQRGDEVHVIDDLSLGYEKNLPPGVTFHHGSILDRTLLADVLKDATFVFHQAALGSVPRSIQDPLRSNEVNVTGTLQVLDAARLARVEKVVFAASSSAYGDTPTLPKHEEMPNNPKSPYAVTKITGELYCRVFHEVYGLRTTALRYFNVYGPKQDPNGSYAAVIPRFVTAALDSRPLTIHGDGLQSRDFTFVADAVQANLLAAASTKADGNVVNVGAGAQTTVLELAQTIRDLAASDAPVVHEPRRAGDVAHSLADLRRARELLGYERRVQIPEGLRRTVDWHRAERGPAPSAALTS